MKTIGQFLALNLSLLLGVLGICVISQEVAINRATKNLEHKN